MKATEDGLEISVSALYRIVYVLGAVGLVLGFFGLKDAFETLGYHSREGHILMAAAAIMGTLTFAAIAGAHIYRRRVLRGL